MMVSSRGDLPGRDAHQVAGTKADQHRRQADHVRRPTMAPAIETMKTRRK